MSNYKIQREKSFNVQIWVGLKETFGEEKVHGIKYVWHLCDQFVNENEDCVSISPTEYRYVDGAEPGALIGFINYPRFPRSKKEIEDRAIALAKHLMSELNQFKVTITTPDESIMLTNMDQKIQRDENA